MWTFYLNGPKPSRKAFMAQIRRMSDTPGISCAFRISSFIFILLSISFCLTPAYGKDEGRPGEEKGPTTVHMDMFVIDVSNIDGAQQTFSAHAYLEISWKDHRLSHNGLQPRKYPVGKIWHPALYIINQKRIYNTPPKELTVSKDGTVRFIQDINGIFLQKLNLKSFPFDKHRFHIVFASLGHGPGEVRFETSKQPKNGIAKELSVTDWEISSWHLGPSTYDPVPGGVKLPGFTFSFMAKRNSVYYIIQIIIPLLIILMIANVAFWIETSLAAAQISISTTALLTMIAYRFVLSSHLPVISYLTRMDIFILGSTVLVGLALVEVIATVRMAEKGRVEESKAFDRKMRFIFPMTVLLLAVYAFLLY
jgi:hypothetical protein